MFGISILILLPLIIFSILYLPFVSTLPYLDGNIQFNMSYDVYAGGIGNYFMQWKSVHPPFKFIADSIFFRMFGVNPATYNILGYIFGLLGIIYLFKLSKSILNKKTAFFASLLLSVSPMFLSAGVFSLTDYLMTVLIVISIYYYSRGDYVLYGLFASVTVLTKETALLLPFSVMIIEGFSYLRTIVKKTGNATLSIIKGLYLILPLIIYSLWGLSLAMSGQKAWNDWNFSSTAREGSFYTILNNLITFKFLNDYAFQSWTQLFFLNFIWIFWGLFIVGLILYLYRNLGYAIKKIYLGEQNTKALLTFIIFSVLYVVMVLSFQTFTVPRYALPVIIPLLIGTAWAIDKITGRFGITGKTLFFIFFATILVVRLFYSLDPISIKLWGQTKVFNLTFYALDKHLAGNEGIAYNMEYLLAARYRSGKIKSAKGYILSGQCDWMFPDPNNDFKMINAFKLYNIDFAFPCSYNYWNNL